MIDFNDADVLQVAGEEANEEDSQVELGRALPTKGWI
jgi:hypothetical protein